MTHIRMTDAFLLFSIKTIVNTCDIMYTEPVKSSLHAQWERRPARIMTPRSFLKRKTLD